MKDLLNPSPPPGAHAGPAGGKSGEKPALNPAAGTDQGTVASAGEKTELAKDSVSQLPWMAWQVGQRVVVRRREADGLYDALGELLEVSPHQVRILTRRGEVTVPAEKMVTGKLVPPPPRLGPTPQA